MRFEKKHTLSSQLWLKRQEKDPYVIKAKSAGYISRAAFKLLEIQNKFNVFKKNAKVLDLGSAPGSWTQVASEFINSGPEKCILSIDLLPTQEITGSTSIIADIFADNINEIISAHLSDKIDIVMSDMAGNTTGDQNTDHLRIMNLCEAAEKIADNFLKINGCMILKIFKGRFENEFISRLKTKFQKVQYFKPDASRKQSCEIYVVCLNYKKNP
jgi:23S rRNA (uridine2552-2'-O)-methyltransferase